MELFHKFSEANTSSVQSCVEYESVSSERKVRFCIKRLLYVNKRPENIKIASKLLYSYADAYKLNAVGSVPNMLQTSCLYCFAEWHVVKKVRVIIN